MGAHLIITNDSSFKIIEEKNVVAIFQEEKNKKLSLKTRADILADISCLRLGDYIFFHNTDKKGITGVYAVDELPFFDDTDLGFDKPAPYRFLVTPIKDLVFNDFVPEEIIFSAKNVSEKFKTIFYKKVLGRGRACTHLFPEETAHLIEYLIKYNSNNKKNSLVKNLYKKPRKCKYITPEFYSDNIELNYEKELEWWLAHNIDKGNKCSLFIDNVDNIETFFNYIPLSIGGFNSDFMVFHNRAVTDRIEKIRYKVTIIELKKGDCGVHGLKEIEKYTKWTSKNIVNGELDIIQPVLIALSFENDVIDMVKNWNLSIKKPILIQYKKSGKSDLKLKRVD